MAWTQLVIALLVFVGTGLQALLAMYGMTTDQSDALAEWEAEGELLKDEPLRRRRTSARVLRRMRTWEMHQAIETMRISFVSWSLLTLASLVAVVASVMQIADG